ncbi:hypothetical protein LCGC14_1175570 [marine sediment metagenome]|uniref:Uncharacterized protein n=1 Tax=marine sediment metagenome TaxID=412755 RepID=A0A0F9PU33_9ZZZZ
MNAGERFDNLMMFKRMRDATGVDRVWKLSTFIKQTPPLFNFDYEVAYAILAMMATAAVHAPFPVQVNKEALGELYEISTKNINSYFDWFCKVDILRQF